MHASYFWTELPKGSEDGACLKSRSSTDMQRRMHKDPGAHHRLSRGSVLPFSHADKKLLQKLLACSSAARGVGHADENPRGFFKGGWRRYAVVPAGILVLVVLSSTNMKEHSVEERRSMQSAYFQQRLRTLRNECECETAARRYLHM